MSTLVTGKSRVAPVKGISIPRLELTAAEILAKLMFSVKRSLEESLVVEKKYYWTDILNALYWINATKDLKQFVDNRAESTRSNAVVCLETGDLHQVLTILSILHLEEHILPL